MKTKTKYTKLKQGDALNLLQENDWSVENCAFGDWDRKLTDGEDLPFITGTLSGIEGGEFTKKETGQQWTYCWKIEEMTEWDIGDRVKSGSMTGTIVRRGKSGGFWVTLFDDGCGSVEGYFHPEDLEPAPESDPFDEWYEEETNLAGKHKRLARLAFDAGRNHERKLHD